MNAAASITITPVGVADLVAEGERMPVCVHVIDHPDARVLVDQHADLINKKCVIAGLTTSHKLQGEARGRQSPHHSSAERRQLHAVVRWPLLR